MVSFLSLPWNGRDPVSISNCRDRAGRRSDSQRRFWKGRAVLGRGPARGPSAPGAGHPHQEPRPHHAHRPHHEHPILTMSPALTRSPALTMSTPKDHQSALCVWPRRFTTSGAMYSMVPQNE